MNGERLLLVGCGILAREVRSLIEKNGWPLDTCFLDSTLHCKFHSLEQSLRAALARNKHRRVIVFYGCCHPLMEKMVEEAHTFRTEGQNCIEMLLGRETFARELERGAFFLFDDWARRWESIVTGTFGTKNVDVIRDMIQGDRKYLLCIRTPYSADFQAEAEKAGALVDLPLEWINVTLDKLESVLAAAVKLKLEELEWTAR